MFNTEYIALQLYSFEDSWTVIRKRTAWKFVWYNEISEWQDMFAKQLPVIANREKVDMIIHVLEKKYPSSFKWIPADDRTKRLLKKLKK